MFRNLQMLQSVLEEVEPALAELKLGPKDFFLLSALGDNPYPAELARALMLPRATVTFLVKQMEAVGYIDRSGEPGDLRRYRLTVTPEGRKAMECGRDILNGAFSRRLQKLDASEVETFRRLVVALSEDEP